MLLKDGRIRYRPAERAALVNNGVRAFCLIGGNMRAAEMGALFLTNVDAMVHACSRPGPFLFGVSREGCRQLV